MAGRNKPVDDGEDAYENEGGALPELKAKPSDEVTGEVDFTDKSLHGNKERLNTVAEDYVRGLDYGGRTVESVELTEVKVTQKVNVHVKYKVKLSG